MDFQLFVDQIHMPCCVLSVEKTKEGLCGDIHIVCANGAYKKTMGPAYYDGMIYYELVPKDNKFEDYCFRAAIKKQRMHAYVETKALNCWTDQTLIPLVSDRDDIGYCQYIFEFTLMAEADRMASVSFTSAEDVIRACIKLMGTEDLRAGITDVAKDIREVTESDAATIVIMDHDNKDAYIFAESTRDGAWPHRDLEEEVINYDLVNSWENVIGVSNELIVKDKHDMDSLRKINEPWVNSLLEHGVNTLVLCPLKQNKAIFGYLYVVNYNVSKVVEIKEFLELMSFFLGSEISNYLLYEKLEEISQVDVLTGLNNRRAMKLRLDRMSARKELTPFGVVNLDLNGLKVANDLYGHEAGDALLIYASEILKSVFSHENIFRTGGDEFLVIKENVSQESFKEKMKQIREEAIKYPDISFAVGDFWSDGTTDITSAFQQADERMYVDKKAYYDSHPEKERRGRRGV